MYVCMYVSMYVCVCVGGGAYIYIIYMYRTYVRCVRITSLSANIPYNPVGDDDNHAQLRPQNANFRQYLFTSRGQVKTDKIPCYS